MANWFTRLFRGEPDQQKQSETGRVVYMNSKQARFMQRKYKSFADEGYTKNVAAYQAINKTADAVASVPWVLYRGDQEITEHPLLTLMQQPNPMQSDAEFRRALVGYYRISGNAYMERVLVGRQPRELYALRPDRMQVIPSESGFPKGYIYKVGNQQVQWPSDPATATSDIRHIKTFHPLDDWYGLSPIEAGAYAVDQHNESMKWMQSLLQNSAMPSGALEMSAENELSDDAFNRLKMEVDEQYSGAANAGRPMILEGGLKWTQMGLSPDDMQVIETKYSAARDVSLALGVPPLLLNIPGDSTFNNYKEARLAFYEDTVIPLANLIRDELNAWLAPMFGDNLRLDYDWDKVPAIAEKRNQLWEMADRSEDLTINERRELKGFEPVSGGDQVFMESSMMPLSGNGAESETAESDSEESADPDRSLNGAQVDALMRIIEAVATGNMPRSTGVSIISASFPLDRDQAERIMGEVGRGFTVSPTDTEQLSSLDPERLKAIAYGVDQ